jgi:hypothetical protein
MPMQPCMKQKLKAAIDRAMRTFKHWFLGFNFQALLKLKNQHLKISNV